MPQDALLPQCAFGIKKLQRWNRTVSQRPPSVFGDALPRQNVDSSLGNGRIEYGEVDRSRRSIQGLKRPRQFLALDLDDRLQLAPRTLARIDREPLDRFHIVWKPPRVSLLAGKPGQCHQPILDPAQI